MLAPHIVASVCIELSSFFYKKIILSSYPFSTWFIFSDIKCLQNDLNQYDRTFYRWNIEYVVPSTAIVSSLYGAFYESFSSEPPLLPYKLCHTCLNLVLKLLYSHEHCSLRLSLLGYPLKESLLWRAFSTDSCLVESFLVDTQKPQEFIEDHDNCSSQRPLL